MSLEVLKQTIASLYKRKGKEVFGAKELEMLASMELRWFEPQDARMLVEAAINMNLLEEIKGGLKINFDYKTIDIPFGFKPPKDLMKEVSHDQDSLFMRIVNQVCLLTDMRQNQVIAEINAKHTKFEDFLLLDVIAILYASDHGVDISEYVKEIKEIIINNPL